MQCPQYMTLLEELRARLLANASTGADSGPIGAERTETISSYIGEPSLSWSSIARNSLTTEPGACRTDGK